MRIILDSYTLYTFYSIRNASYKQMAEVSDVIDASTRARPSGYEYMPAFKSGRWDGYIRLRRGASFPTGLVGLVISGLALGGYSDVEVKKHSDSPVIWADGIQENMFGDIALRPYQLQAARLCCSYSRGILKMATNSGKTAVIAAVAKVVASGGVIVLTTKKDLLYQTAGRLSEHLEEEVGYVGAGGWEVRRVTVGMIQTLCRHIPRMKKELGGLACVMFDECHHIPSKTSQAVMLGLDAPLRFGFSGTPLRNDDLNDLLLMAATGPVLLEVTNENLISAGISARPCVDMYTVENPDMHNASWQEAYDLCICQSEERNGYIQAQVTSRNAHSALILVDRINHGIELQTRLSCVFVHGSSSMDDRAAALEALRQGNGAMVIATAAIFGEGVDVPAVDLLVLAGGGKGHIKLLQNIGRGMRRKEGSNTLQVVDFVDDTSDYLLQHSLARAELYEQEGFEVRVHE